MHGVSRKRKRAPGPLVALWVTVASLAIHGLVAAAVGAQGYLREALGAAALGPARSGAQAEKAPRPEAGPVPSCEADEALATAAQVIYCATPLGPRDREACLRQALEELRVGRARCHATNLPTSVALLDPKVLDQIEPAPLETLLAPEPPRPEKAPEPSPAQAQPQQPQPPPSPPTQPMQVVEVTRPDTEEAPENARFLSEYDTRVEKETVARGSTEQMVERPGARELQPVSRPREASAQEMPEEPAQTVAKRPDAPDGPGRLDMRQPGAPEPARLPREETTPGILDGSETPPTESGMLARKGTGARREEAQEAANGPRGEGGAGGGGRPLVPNLRPTEEVLERAVGGGSVDMTRGVEEGEVTALNSKQWKFASFFNRLKRQIAQTWNPQAVLVRRDPTGKSYGTADRVTYVQVALDASGAVLDIVVVKSSGVSELDAEAMRAIRAAQPFPNPPGGLVDQRTGRITFPFGFHVQMGAQGWKIFRYR